MADQDKTKKMNQSRPYSGRRKIEDPDALINDMPIICERIRFYRERKGIEQKMLAEAIGIKKNAVSNWESGRSRPDMALLPKICKVLEVSMDELFGLPAPGESAPKPDTTTPSRKLSGEEIAMEKYLRLSRVHRSVVDALLDKLGEVEDDALYDSITEETLFTKQLCAGYDPGLEFDDPGETIHLYRDKIDPRMDCIFPVSGDSMEPDFHDGDRVMVQRLHDRSELEVGEIGAFIFGNETYIKQYSKAGLRSLNKKYKMMRFHEDESVYIIGRVLGVLSPDAVVSYEDIMRYEKAKKRIEEREAEEE